MINKDITFAEKIISDSIDNNNNILKLNYSIISFISYYLYLIKWCLYIIYGISDYYYYFFCFIGTNYFIDIILFGSSIICLILINCVY